MDRKGFRGPLALCAAIILALPLLGCADADVIGSAAGGITVKVVPSGDVGRCAPGTWGVTTFNFLPVDPTTRAALGGQAFAFSGNLIAVDLSGATPPTSITVTLAAGTYEVSALELIDLTLQNCSSGPPPLTCYDAAASPPVQPSSVRVVSFTPPLQFVVTAQGSHTIELRVDVSALLDAYRTSYDCINGTLFLYNGVSFVQGLSSGVFTLVQTQ